MDDKFRERGVAGWVHREQQALIDYLREENAILCGQLGVKRVRFTDAQRRCLAVKGTVGEGHLRRLLREYVAHYQATTTLTQGASGSGTGPPRRRMAMSP